MSLSSACARLASIASSDHLHHLAQSYRVLKYALDSCVEPGHHARHRLRDDCISCASTGSSDRMAVLTTSFKYLAGDSMFERWSKRLLAVSVSRSCLKFEIRWFIFNTVKPKRIILETYMAAAIGTAVLQPECLIRRGVKGGMWCHHLSQLLPRVTEFFVNLCAV